jgi:hypothetical protein
MHTVEIYARGATGGSCGWQEPAGGGPGVWAVAEDGKQDAGVFVAARISAAEACQTAEARGLARRHRCHIARRQAAAEEATAHGHGDHLYNIFDFTLNRGRDGPNYFLQNYNQVLLADAWTGKILERGRENRCASKYLSGSQPVQKYLSSLIGDHEVPAMTASLNFHGVQFA